MKLGIWRLHKKFQSLLETKATSPPNPNNRYFVFNAPKSAKPTRKYQ